MKTFLFTIMSFLFLELLTSCKSVPDAKILIVGDSWGALMCYNATFDSILSKHDLASKYRTECLTTTQIGTRAEGWAEPTNLDKITRILAIDAGVDYVILSMGGNDYIQYWNRFLTPDEEFATFNKIGDWIKTVVRHIQTIKPGVKIILTSYDYANFEVLKASPLYNVYQNLYKNMGSPTVSELNLSLQRFTAMQMQVARDMNIVAVNNLGMMQYYYGQSDFNIAPLTVPMPGGDPRYPGPKEAMFEVQKLDYVDAYHLDRKGFEIIGERIYNDHINIQ